MPGRIQLDLEKMKGWTFKDRSWSQPLCPLCKRPIRTILEHPRPGYDGYLIRHTSPGDCRIVPETPNIEAIPIPASCNRTEHKSE
jgi:hypothetical protein